MENNNHNQNYESMNKWRGYLTFTNDDFYPEVTSTEDSVISLFMAKRLRGLYSNKSSSYTNISTTNPGKIGKPSFKKNSKNPKIIYFLTIITT